MSAVLPLSVPHGRLLPAADELACSECGRILVGGGIHDSVCSKGGGS